tara:strand:- start:102 stop:1130 length:1029 start_codon:yes stop_codon:yes gene_type:complete
MQIDVFDFFSGCGGTSCGFRDAGFNIKMGLDIDHDSAETFRLNFPTAKFIENDIRRIMPEDIADIVNRSNPILFCGCAPCQPFSKQNRQQNKDDKRLDLLDEFGRFVKYWLPEFVFIENVPGMQHKAAKSETFNRFTKMLSDLGYNYETKVVDAQWYGVPQKRSRLILSAALKQNIELPMPTHGKKLKPFSTTREWISNLPAIEHGKVDAVDLDHFAMKLSDTNLSRIKATPEGGGREHWPDHLILPCHRGYTGHVDVYGRMSWDKPAVGLTTKCTSYSNGRFGHPTQDRAISLREAACLQTFPRSFKFLGSRTSRARQVGNAVPPLMAKCVGHSIKNALQT